jgi:hypothetical protein
MVEPRRQPRRIVVSGPKRDNRRGANHHEHQSDERREDEDPDWQAISTATVTAIFSGATALAILQFGS